MWWRIETKPRGGRLMDHSVCDRCLVCDQGLVCSCLRPQRGSPEFYLLRIIIVLVLLNLLVLFSFTTFVVIDDKSKFASIDDNNIFQEVKAHATSLFIPASRLGLEPSWNKSAVIRGEPMFQFLSGEELEDMKGKFWLSEDAKPYFLEAEGERCLYEGTDVTGTYKVLARKLRGCKCVQGWQGRYCSLPQDDVIQGLVKAGHVAVRPIPRRLILASLYNNNTHAWINGLHRQFVMVGEIMDAFLILWPWDNPYIHHNTPPPGKTHPENSRAIFMQELWMSLRGTDHYRKVDHKIVHAFLGDNDTYIGNVTTNNSTTQHNISTSFRRALTSLAWKGLSQVRKYRADDIVILTDARWTPTKDLALFLKVHSAFPEVFSLGHDGKVMAGLGEGPETEGSFCVGLTLRALRRIVGKGKTSGKKAAYDSGLSGLTTPSTTAKAPKLILTTRKPRTGTQGPPTTPKH